MMTKSILRYYRLIRKFGIILMLGWRPSAVRGRWHAPAVILNSLPKAGTNLLQQALHHLPPLRGTISRTITSQNYEEFGRKRIMTLKMGQCLPAHLIYRQDIADLIGRRNIRMIFMVRDMRDAIVSHLHYIEHIDVTHSHHRYFQTLTSRSEKFRACLYGVPDLIQPWRKLLEDFRGWFYSPNVHVVRFEQLIGPAGGGQTEMQRRVLEGICDYLGIRNVSIDSIIESLPDSHGLTYNKPGVEKWRLALSAEEVEMIEREIGDLIEEYGYRRSTSDSPSALIVAGGSKDDKK